MKRGGRWPTTEGGGSRPSGRLGGKNRQCSIAGRLRVSEQEINRLKGLGGQGGPRGREPQGLEVGIRPEKTKFHWGGWQDKVNNTGEGRRGGVNLHVWLGEGFS